MDPPNATIALHFSDLDDPRRAAGQASQFNRHHGYRNLCHYLRC